MCRQAELLCTDSRHTSAVVHILLLIELNGG